MTSDQDTVEPWKWAARKDRARAESLERGADSRAHTRQKAG